MRTDLALPLLDLIRRGTEACPVTGAEIAAALNRDHGDPRHPLNSSHVRELVNWLRAAGDPNHAKIASNGDGYWWCEDWSEMQHTLAHLGSRIEHIDKARRGICRAFKRSEQQAEMAL